MPLHYRTCNLCEAMCGLEIEYEHDKVLTIKGDKQDPFSEGHICPKAMALKDIYEDKDRLKKPLKKTPDGWKEISWTQAIDEVTENLAKIGNKYGTDAVGIYSGNPNVHNSGTILSAPGFLRALKTKNRFSATSVDQLPHQFVAYLMFGHQSQLPIPDIDRTDYLVILGANPIISNGSLLSAPNIKKRLQRIQERGGKIINIDPRFTETSSKSDQHIYIRPGSDVFLMLGMLHVLFNEGLIDLGRFKNDIYGLDQVKSLAGEYSPESVAEITGISSSTIKTLTRDFASKEKAVLYGRMGACTQEFGGMSMWLVSVINILTGNFDEAGGYMFTSPAIDFKPTSSRGHVNRWSSRVRGLPEVGGELPASTMAEEILTEGEGQIKAMIINAGNPVLSTPNGIQLEKAFESLEFMVSIDIYLNETSKLANIILPPATGLEVELYDLVFHTLSVRNTSKYSEALFKPEKGAKFDWEIFRALRKAYLSKVGAYSIGKRIESISESFVKPEKMIDILLKKGAYGDQLSIDYLKENPHGIDLGALKSQMPEALYNVDKKINLFPREISNDQERVKQKLEDFIIEDSEFLLIGRRQLRTCNTWLHNSQRLIKNNPCNLLIHPLDAESLKLIGNTEIKVKSRVGEILIPFETTENIMRGTVSLPHGWGHKGAIQMDIAKSSPGVSINDLTDETFIDELTGNAALNGVPVTLEAV